MKEFIEKLIGRLEEKFKYNSEQAEIWRNGSDKDAYFRGQKDLYMDRANTYGEVMRIVNQLAEEYKTEHIVGLCNQFCDKADEILQKNNNGWILCSERLPEESLNSVIGWDEYRNRCCFVQYIGGRWVLGNDIDSVKIIAWQPLPEPWKAGEAE